MRVFVGLNILIISIIVIRSLVEGKISRKKQYGMWAMVPLFLVISVFFRIPIAMPGNIEAKEVRNPVYVSYERTVENSSLDIVSRDKISNEELIKEETNPQKIQPIVNASKIKSSHIKYNPESVVKIVWGAGSAVVALVIIINNLVFINKIRRERRFVGNSSLGNLPIFELKNLKSPFLLGKSIYISEETKENTDKYNYAVCHEYSHFKNGDSIWPVVKYIVISLFWFDPLVWVACVIFRRDSELAADERVIELMGREHKASYSETLLTFLDNKYEKSEILTVTTSMNGRSNSFIKSRIINIMRGTRKSVLSSVLVISFFVSAVGCALVDPQNNDSFEGMELDSSGQFTSNEQTSWYDTETEFIDFNSRETKVISITDDGFIYLDNEPQSLETDEDGNEIARDSWWIRKHVNGKGDTSSIDINSYISGPNFKVAKWNDELYLVVPAAYDSIVLHKVDIDNGTIGEAITSESLNKLFASGGSSFEISNYQDELVFVINLYEGGASVVKLDKDLNATKLKLGTTMYRSPFDSARMLDDKELLLTFYSDKEAPYEYLAVNLETEEGKRIEDGTNLYMFARELNQNTYIGSSGVYSTDEYGVVKYNPKTGENEKVLDFNDSNFNRSNWIQLLDVVDDSFYFYGVCAQNEYDLKYGLMKFTKSDNDLRDGKIILKAANASDDFSVDVARAVYEFNKTSDKYFIAMTDAYCGNYFYPTSADTDTKEKELKYKSEILDGKIKLSSVLEENLKNSDDIDIIFNAYEYTSINNSKCLMDLTDKVDFKDCFETAINEKENYQIPLSFTLMGLIADELSGDDLGMTVERLNNETTNRYIFGVYARSDAFKFLINSTKGGYIKDGKIDVNCQQFKTILDYLKDYPESIRDIDDAFEGSMDVWFGDFFGVDGYKVFGLPQLDGYSAPVICYRSSVGIASSCKNKEGAIEFINFALSEDMQSNPGESFIPVNRNGYKKYLEHINSKGSLMITEPEANQTIKSIDKALYMNPIDPEIQKIMWEESQAYMSGDRSFEETAKIIEDRAQKVFDERK